MCVDPLSGNRVIPRVYHGTHNRYIITCINKFLISNSSGTEYNIATNTFLREYYYCIFIAYTLNNVMRDDERRVPATHRRNINSRAGRVFFKFITISLIRL